MTASPSTSAQWHSVTPSTRPLSLSILELTPLALTLSLTLASPFASSSSLSSQIPGPSNLLGTPTPASKRKKRPRKTESDDESTAVEVDDDHPSHPHLGHLIPGSWPSEVGQSFKDLLSHGVVVSVNGQPWSRIVAHASDPDPEPSDSDLAEGAEGDDEWDEEWDHAAHAGGKSDEEAEEGLGAEGIQRRRPRRARFSLAAQNAAGGPVRRKERKERAEKEKDRAVVVVYGLSPGKEYEIELRVVGMSGAEEGTVSNSVLIPPSPAGSLHPRSRANSLRSRQHPRSRSNSMNAPSSSSENPTPSGHATPPLNSTGSTETIIPTPVLSAADTQTAQMRHLLASASAEKEHLSSQIKEARRASQRAEAQLRQEIDAVKKATEKAGTMDLRAKQKALALQEQVKQGWAGAEVAEKETTQVEAGMEDLESRLEGVRIEVEASRTELASVKEREEDVREKDKRARAEEEKKLVEVVGKLEKLKIKKERKEAEKVELERRIEDLERQKEEVERQAEEETRRRAGGHWGNSHHWGGEHHHEAGHRVLTAHPSLSNIGAQGGYGAGPAYRPRGAQGYQPRFPSAGAVRPGAGAGVGAGSGGNNNNIAQPSPTHQNTFYNPSSTNPSFRPPAKTTNSNPGPSSASPAISTRAVSTSSGVNASAAPFVPGSYTANSGFDHHTTLMPPGMQHRIYLPSSASNYQSVRPRPTPTFHPPPSVLAEQAAHAATQAKNSPTSLSPPAFPPLPTVSTATGGGGGGTSPKPLSSPTGPSLASIVTRAVLSPTSTLAVQNLNISQAPSPSTVTRPSPPSSVTPGSGTNGLKSPTIAAFPNSPNSPGPPPNPYAQTSLGRVTFAPPPTQQSSGDFPPLSPSGPWSSLNPSIGSRVRGDSGDTPRVSTGGAGQSQYGLGMVRTQTPPSMGMVWGNQGGERVASPFSPGGRDSGSGSAGSGGQSRKGTE